MKKVLNKMKATSTNLINRAKVMFTTATLATATLNTNVVNAAGDPKEVVTAAIDTVVKFFPYVGAFFVVSGIFKLIMAYRNDQPEAQAGAAKDIVVGAVFIAFDVFAWPTIKAVI